MLRPDFFIRSSSSLRQPTVHRPIRDRSGIVDARCRHFGFGIVAGDIAEAEIGGEDGTIGGFAISGKDGRFQPDAVIAILDGMGGKGL